MTDVLGIWPTLRPLSVARRRQRQLPYPLQDQHLTLSACGRHSLWLGLRALGVGDGDEVLAPGYHHGSEIEAIARTGAKCRFYGGTARLEPEENELEALLGPSVRALHLTHYLGFAQDSERWRQWCSDRGLLLLEDAAQSWLSERAGLPLGSSGDLAIFCLYKSVGVPDGGALVCRAPVQIEHRRAAGGLVETAKLATLWAAQRSLVPTGIAMREGGEFDHSVEIALGDPTTPPSRATSFALARFDYARVRERRQRNYRRLLTTIGERVPAPFEDLTEGTSPWAFPVTLDDKTGFLQHLWRAGIKGADFWSVSHPVFDDDRFPGLAERRATTVGLPCHQELSDRDIDRIAEVAKSWSH